MTRISMIDKTLGAYGRMRWLPLAWDVVPAAVLAGTAVHEHSYSLLHLLIGLCMAAVLPARRHAPVSVFGVVAALALVHMIESATASYDVAVLFAMVAVVAHAQSLWAVYGSGVVAAGIFILERTYEPYDGWILGTYHFVGYVSILAACMALWLVAYVLRSNRERHDALRERARAAVRERDHLTRLAVANERASIARELHDVVAHSLAVMIAQADGASYAIDSEAARAREAMRSVAGIGRDALADMHRIVAVLRGAHQDEAFDGGTDRRRRRLRELPDLLEQVSRSGLRVSSSVDGPLDGLSAAQELTVFQIMREALTNVLRHAGPGAHVQVTLRIGEGSATLEVLDDGGGEGRDGRTSRDRLAGGNGVIGMRERVAVHRGELSAGPCDGAGWRVRAVIPIEGVS